MTVHWVALIAKTVLFFFLAVWPLANAYAEPNRRFRPSRRIAWGIFASMVAFILSPWIKMLPVPRADILGTALLYVAAFNGIPLLLVYAWLSIRHTQARKKGVGKVSV